VAAGAVVNVTLCIRGLDPARAVGVQAAGLGVTVGGGAPIATTFGRAPVVLLATRAKLPGFPLKTKSIVPEIRLVDGTVAGTAVIIFPSGMVTVALIVARGDPAKSTRQLLMAIESGPPMTSVNVTLTGGVDVVEQLKPASPIPETPV
jgi:hypothetical protein